MSENGISTPGKGQKYQQSTVCVMCEFVMSQVDNYLEDNTTKVGVWWTCFRAQKRREEGKGSYCALFVRLGVRY